MKNLAIPPFKPGDKAYIISPSAGLMPFIPNRVERARKHLEKLGYKVVIGKSASLNNGYVSAGIDERVKDIHDAFRDKSCNLVLCSIGGNHSNQLLDKIDYDLIRENPKAFCGYSDITVLHLAFLAKAGLTTFYGPTFLNQFGEYPEVLGFTLKHFKKTVMQQKDIQVERISREYTNEILDWFANTDSKRPRKLLPNPPLKIWKHGKAEGNVLPFTVPSINHVINTEYMPNIEEPILFIDIPEGASMNEGLSVGEFDSWFSDLVRSGLVGKARGIVIGRAYKYSQEMVEELGSVIREQCNSFNIPIVYGLDIGHTDPMLSIMYTSRVTLDTKSETIVDFE